jgi:hypothetical protein
MVKNSVLPIERGGFESAAVTATGTAGGTIKGALKGYGFSALLGAAATGLAIAFAPVALGGWAIAGLVAAGAVATTAVLGTFTAAVGAVGGTVNGFKNSREQLNQERAAVNIVRAQGAVASAQEQTAAALQTQVAQEMVQAGPSTRFVPANNVQYAGPMQANGQQLGAGNVGNVMAMRQQQAALGEQAQIG